MFRDNASIKPTQKLVNCVLMNGGVGDHIGGSLIAVDYIIRTYPWITLHVWTPDFLVEFAKNVLPANAIVRGYKDMKNKYNPNVTTISTQWDGRVSPMKTHQTDYAFQVLCDERVPDEKKNYLKVNTKKVKLDKYSLPERFVTIATGYTAEVREFAPKSVNEITRYLLARGYTPVFIGQTETATGAAHIIKGEFNEEIDYSKGINLIDKTSLLECAAIIEKSKVMIGVDCGLIHVAGCTDTAIVGGYTTVSPELRAPIRHDTQGWNWHPVYPSEKLGCRFCQVKTNFLYGHDYKKCLYIELKKDTSIRCVEELTADKFISQLEKIL